MKYVDPITKEVKTISVKASDTLPIGSIVDFEGDTIPEGWESLEAYEHITDCNDTSLEPGCYYGNSETTNIPYSSIWFINVMKRNDNIVQIAYRYRDAQVYMREYNGVGGTTDWKPWKNLVSENDIWYKNGDTYEISMATYLAGQISGGATQVLFTIPLPKRLNKIKGVTVSSYDITVRQATGGYILNRVTENLTVEANPRQDNLLCFIVTTPEAMNTVNNTPCGVTLYNLKVTFSE